MKRRDFLKTATVALAAQLGKGSTGFAQDMQGGLGSMNALDLRCEFRSDPVGIDNPVPSLKWLLKSTTPGVRNQSQSAYCIQAASSAARLRAGEADLWDTGKVASPQSINIPYAGKPLGSRQAVWWKVRVWDQDGKPTHWSDPGTWSMGLLHPSDWEGKWIGLDEGEGESEELRGAHWITAVSGAPEGLWFRKTFSVSESNPVTYAQIMTVGSNPIILYVNGKEVKPHFVNEQTLLPYFKDTSINFVAKTITPYLLHGTNVVAIHAPAAAIPTSVMTGLSLDLHNRDTQYLRTGEDWKVSGRSIDGWQSPEFNDDSWDHAKLNTSLSLPELAKKGERTRLPARMLRKQFHGKESVRRATAYISGLGYHELYLNGLKISNDVLSPALTDYDKRVTYVTHDVTGQVRSGENCIGVHLGNGRFFAPRCYVPLYTRNFGYPKAIFQLEIEYDNGEVQRIASDETWRISDGGPIRANNNYDGEEYDARMERQGWTMPGFPDKEWLPARIVEAPKGTLCAQMIDPIRIMREVKPVKVTQPLPGVFVFDMGQNMVGWCRMRVSGASGTRISLHHGESLSDDGTVYVDNLRSAKQMDVYTLSGQGEEIYEPRFTSHGFQFVEVHGFPGTPTLETLTGRVATDSMEEHPDFATSDQTINKVYQNVLWGDRGNYHSIPTDCTQRDERQGWLGDRSAESKGESYIYNVRNFYAQWVQHIADSMDEQGRVNDVAPAYWPMYNENVVWPASFFIVPKVLHRQYGDTSVIRKQYPSMKRWIDHMRPFIKDGLMPVDLYGDWCVPPKSLKLIHSNDPKMNTAKEVLGSTYFYYILRLMSEFAVLSGYPEEQSGFDEMAERLKAAFNARYYHAGSNLYDNGTQTASVLALAFDMVPPAHRKAVFDVLVHKIEGETKGHVGTGLVGTQWLMQTLTENGRPDVAVQIASQTTYPSWGYMKERGATTIWELWNGDTADPAMNSRNHLMLVGDLCTWFYEDLAGIRPDEKIPGFKHIIVRPVPTQGLTFVRASHNSPYGRIATDWRREGNRFTLAVSIPPNTTATVYVPASNPDRVKESGEQRRHSVSSTYAGHPTAVYELGSGEYSFSSELS